jgi:NAD(P)-dependent dehydrogenase (short-subunit alcohol dehydrogenase family)
MKIEKLFDVRDHVAFVTGAASGLGFGMAEVMADNGAKVVMTDIDAEGLTKAAATLRDRGLAVEEAVVDVADLDSLTAAIDAAAARHGRLDAVFANAGISAGPGYRTEAGQMNAVSLETWNKVLHINLTSIFETIRAAAAHMKKQRSGRIIITSSIAGVGSEHMVGYAYAATKAAVNNLVRQASQELAAYDVTVNSIAPGPFRTNIGNGRLNDPEVVRQFAEIVPLGRLAEVDEIKGLALLLASSASSFITGTVIPIDGGATA